MFGPFGCYFLATCTCFVSRVLIGPIHLVRCSGPKSITMKFNKRFLKIVARLKKIQTRFSNFITTFRFIFNLIEVAKILIGLIW